jgi:hypothetical protein
MYLLDAVAAIPISSLISFVGSWIGHHLEAFWLLTNKIICPLHADL